MEGPTLFMAPSKSAWVTGRASSISTSLPWLPPASRKAQLVKQSVTAVTDVTVTAEYEVAAPMRQLVANGKLAQRLLCGQNTAKTSWHQEEHCNLQLYCNHCCNLAIVDATNFQLA